MPEKHSNDIQPAGYEALVRRYGLDVIPNWHRSFVTAGGAHRVETTSSVTDEFFNSKYWPGDKVGDHLEFALKYDGTNLAILASLFSAIASADLLDYIKSKPTGKYARRLWYLYEFLSGSTLALDDLKQGNYVDLLDPDEYYTVRPPRPIRRQRVNDNLLGDSRFCPTVRRTDVLHRYQAADLTERCRQVTSAYSPELLKRALSYLYTKETRSSFAIEHIEPNPTRTERFVALLQLAEQRDFCEKSALIDLQNRIVDPRFHNSGYRETQNYVGESVAWRREKIHFASPKPGDLETLMEGLIACHLRMDTAEVSPVVHAAAIAYGFVFLHPFDDGNGRIHRFLIHNILARKGFTPRGIMFPVSASMLRNPVEYESSLQSFSKPLMTLIDFELNQDGQMTVLGDTVRWYAFIDMTQQAEALFRFIEHTINTDLVEELSFLAHYDDAKSAIQQIVDMPDRHVDLLIRFCLQNDGRLSAAKRKSHFEFLTDDEIWRVEKAIRSAYGSDDQSD